MTLSPVLRVFSVLYWAGFLFNSVKTPFFTYPVGWPLALACLAGLVGLSCAHSVKGGTLAHTLQIAAFLLASPHPSNYQTTNTFISLAWLLCMVGVPREKCFRSAVLVIFCFVYGLAGLLKLNNCFLNLELSPVRSLVENHRILAPVAQWLSGLTGHSPLPGLTGVGIVATMGLELAIPFLLLARRTRFLGLGLDLVLHLMMGLRTIPVSLNFPLLQLAVWLLWLPRGSFGWVPRRVPRWAGKRKMVYRLALAVSVLGLAGSVRLGIASAVLTVLVNLFWLFAILLLFAWWIALLRRSVFGSRSRYFPVQMGNLPSVALVLLLALNGICPYVGLKTMGSLEMFSGYLHIGGRTNHLLVPYVDWFGDQTRRWVQVLNSSDKTLQGYADAQVAVSRTELRRLCKQAQSDTSLTYWEAGVVRQVPSVGEDGELGKPMGVLHRYFLNTMKVPLPRLKELGLETYQPTRLPTASDSLFLSP